ARNGLFVNGERLTGGDERLLQEADSVSLGGVALTFTMHGDWPEGLEAEWGQGGAFEGRTEVTTTAAATLVGQLHQAVERNQLTLHYQPKVALATGKLEAAECLLRWNHPSG